MRNKDVYLVNRILFTKVEETMPRYCPTVCFARIEQPHYPIIVGDNTVHVGYSVHGYSGQPVIVAIWLGTEFLHSKRFPPVTVAIFGWSQGGHYNRRVLYNG